MVYRRSAENQPDKSEIFKEITEQMAATYEKKNHDYGNSFEKAMNEFGFVSSVIRLSDKVERLKSFAKMPPEQMQVKEESVEDTLLDLANYAVMTLVELKSE